VGVAGRRTLEAGRGQRAGEARHSLSDPTAFSAHPLISLVRDADDLVDALTHESLLEIAWEDHGFRGPLGTVGKARNALLQSRLIERIDAVLPMPDAPVMLALLDKLAA
jgi:hypothetical protein